MQFTISTITIVASVLASSVQGMPVDVFKRQTCGASPAATGSQTPLQAPSASTAETCKAACAAMSGCESFVFGLPASANTPICRLFSVPAAQVPAQETNLEVFDVACSNVPVTAPTSDHPVGQTQAQEQGQGTSSSQTGQTGSQGSSQGPSQGQQKRDVCGAAPAGPSTNAPSPLKTDSGISDAASCLALGKATSGCKSVEFGKPAANSAQQCLLFQVSASQLPPRTQGQTFMAYDISC